MKGRWVVQVGLSAAELAAVTTQEQEDRLSYGQWVEYAERKHRAGLRQLFCDRCCKWRWPDVVCCGASRVTRQQWLAELQALGVDTRGL